jgi:exopolyphosphatase/guanosine-5'-triphosphate,3'-diphosphate pyrophosphatase
VVVLAYVGRADEFPDSATLLLDAYGRAGARALRSAIDWCQREGHDAVVVALATAGLAFESASWSTLAQTTKGPIAIISGTGPAPELARISAEAWPTVPLDGPVGHVTTARPELVVEIEPSTVAHRTTERAEGPPTVDELATVTRLLGRPPRGAFTVVVRTASGEPIVIENAPFLDDGTPMPTRYWLIGKQEQEAVGRLESGGGVRRAAEALSASQIAEAHARYAAARDARIPSDHEGPRPYGGVGGTREGVKCLHAHLAWYLAGGSDPVGRWTAQQLAGEIDGPTGVIDCGTNSTRLLVVGRNGETVAREMMITRLGEGVDRTGALSLEAIARTLSVLQHYRELLDTHGVVSVRAVATSAARDASNAEAFFDQAHAILGVRPELLTGDEEGRLSYAGATADLDASRGPYFVCDLGGGSTELVAGGVPNDAVPRAAVSLDLGCVRITERFLHADPPSPDEIATARAYVGTLVAQTIDEHPRLGDPTVMIGLAGTVSALTALALGLDAYDHDKLHLATLTRTQVEGYLDEFTAMSLAERRRRSGLEPGRAEVILGGALVLAVVMDVFDHDTLIYSESDILDGLAKDVQKSHTVGTGAADIFSAPSGLASSGDE